MSGNSFAEKVGFYLTGNSINGREKEEESYKVVECQIVPNDQMAEVSFLESKKVKV